MNFTRFFGVLTLVAYSANSFAGPKDTIERFGDITQIIVPAYAFGMAMQEEGWEGVKQFGYSFMAAQASVELLKYAVDEERPNGKDNRSFPSGHTAAAFSGATFIHKRYGIEKAIIPYLLAGFTGFSRIYADKHYWHDVVAGAVISSLFTWFFVSGKSNFQISVAPSSVSVGFQTEF